MIDGELEPRFLNYCSNMCQQAFVGVLVAKANKRANFNEVLDQYLTFLQSVKEEVEKVGDYNEANEDDYWNILMKNLAFLKGE